MNIIDLFIYLLLCGLVMYVLWWGLSKIGLPEPFGKVATALLVIVTVILVLRPLLGGALPHFGFTI